MIIFLVVAFALRPNAIKLHNGAEQIRGMSEVDAAEYTMMELVGSHAGENYVPRLEPLVQEAGGSIETQLDASQYREVLKSYGSLGSSLHSVETANEPIPAVADATMVTGYGMYLQGIEPPTSEEGCTEVTEASRGQRVYFELASGGVLISNVGHQKTEVQAPLHRRQARGPGRRLHAGRLGRTEDPARPRPDPLERDRDGPGGSARWATAEARPGPPGRTPP